MPKSKKHMQIGRQTRYTVYDDITRLYVLITSPTGCIWSMKSCTFACSEVTKNVCPNVL